MGSTRLSESMPAKNSCGGKPVHPARTEVGHLGTGDPDRCCLRREVSDRLKETVTRKKEGVEG